MMLVCGENNYLQISAKSNNKNSKGNPIISPPIEFHIDPRTISSISTNFQQTVFITQDGKSYVTGYNRNGIICGTFPSDILPVDTEFSLKNQNERPFNFISVVCGAYYTLYLVTDASKFHLVLCYSDRTPNPLFVNIGNRTPKSLFGGYYTAGVIDSEGGIIVLKQPLFKSPSQEIETYFLPNNDKAVKIACCYSFFVCLGLSGRVYKSQISGTLPINFVEIDIDGKTAVDVCGTYDFCFVVLDDGRVLGSGSNWHCKLGFPEEISCVSVFTEIESLKKYKIVSAFAGSSHSIFKTIDRKMIVCGYNNSGQLFIPPKEIVFPPEEVEMCQGFSFCETGDCSSIAFVGIDPPKNISNMKICEPNVKVENQKAFNFMNEVVKSTSENSEIEELKKKLASKENEIISLKKENSLLKNMINYNKIYIEEFEEK